VREKFLVKTLGDFLSSLDVVEMGNMEVDLIYREAGWTRVVECELKMLMG